jgi:hypothetical protein
MALVPPGKGGGEGVAGGGTGQGVLLHRLTAGDGMPVAPRTPPAHGDERAQGRPWLEAVTGRPGPRGRPRKWLNVIATATGYEATALRQRLRPRGIRAQMPHRVWKTTHNRGRPITKVVPRFQAERPFAWLPQKYRRLVVRWERMAACFDAWLAMATMHLWIQRLIGG